jgi:hypothetical protein
MRRAQVIFVILLTAAANGAGQNTDDSNSTTSSQTDKPLDPDAAKRWQELHDQTLVLQEQQKLTTAQQDAFKTFLPTLPQGVTPGFERKGDPSVRGTAAAYDALRMLSRDFARNVAGVKPALKNCDDLKAKEKSACEARNANPPDSDPSKHYTAIWLHGQREAKAMAQIPVLTSQLKTLVCRLAIEAHVDQPGCQAAPSTAEAHGHFMALSPALIAPLVQTALGIFELFRTKVTITSTTVSVDELSFSAMVAGELRKLRTADQIYYASAFPLPTGKSEILNQAEALRTLIEKLSLQIRDLKQKQADQTKATAKADAAAASLKTQIKAANDRMNELDARIANTPDKELRTFWQGRRADAETARDAMQKQLDQTAQPAADAADAQSEALAASIKQLQDLTDKAIAFQGSLYDKVDDDTLLAKILRLESAKKEWDACPEISVEKRCAAMQLTVVSAGAEMKQRQNYWSTGESIGGGSVAAYLLYDPKNGAVLDGGSETRFLPHVRE